MSRLPTTLVRFLCPVLASLAGSASMASDRDCPGGTLYSRALDGTFECVRAAAAADAGSPRSDQTANFGTAVRNQGRDAGIWSLPSPSATNSSARSCVATYKLRDQAVSIALLGGAKPSAQVVFSGPLVPKPAKSNQRVTVTLRQPGESAQTVQAGHSPQGAAGSALMVAVPSAQAALDSLEERNAFELTLNGTKVIDIAWEDGLAAKSALEQCWKKN